MEPLRYLGYSRNVAFARALILVCLEIHVRGCGLNARAIYELQVYHVQHTN